MLKCEHATCMGISNYEKRKRNVGGCSCKKSPERESHVFFFFHNSSLSIQGQEGLQKRFTKPRYKFESHQSILKKLSASWFKCLSVLSIACQFFFIPWPPPTLRVKWLDRKLVFKCLNANMLLVWTSQIMKKEKEM